MEAFHNDPFSKFAAVRTLQNFAQRNKLAHGYYWDETTQTGCAVGALVKNGEHPEFQAKYDLPWFIGKLLERIFEGLPLEEAGVFVPKFMQAIPVGGSLEDFQSRLVFEILRKKGLVTMDDLEPSLGSLKMVRDSWEPGSKLRNVLDALVSDDTERFKFLVHWFGRNKTFAMGLILDVLAKSKTPVPAKIDDLRKQCELV